MIKMKTKMIALAIMCFVFFGGTCLAESSEKKANQNLSIGVRSTTTLAKSSDTVTIITEEAPYDVYNQDPFTAPILSNPEKVDEIVKSLRDATQADDWRASSKALHRVIRRDYVTGIVSLRYSNQEIKDAVVDLYLLEAAKKKELPSKENPWGNPWHGGEGGAEYITALATVAEATLSPRIYDVELFGKIWMGELQPHYLARVHPAKTLDIILRAVPGFVPTHFLAIKLEDVTLEVSENRENFFASFVRDDPPTRAGLLTVFDYEEPFFILSEMRSTAPDLLKKHEEEIHQFVKANVFHFSPSSSTPSPPRDYRVRNYALDLYEFWKDPAYIPDVKNLIYSAPKIDEEFVARYHGNWENKEQIVDKVDRVIKLLSSEK